MPAATAASIPAPSAQAWSEATTRMGMPSTSAVTCITNGLLRAMPPWAITDHRHAFLAELLHDGP